MYRPSFLFAVVVASLLLNLIASQPSRAKGCCAGQPLGATTPARLALLPAAPEPIARRWVPAAPQHHNRPTVKAPGSRELDYHVKSHLWLMGGVHTLPTGQPLGSNTSNAERTFYSQAGVGLGYSLSPAVRAITNWNTGLGHFSATPGSQFTVGVSLHYR